MAQMKYYYELTISSSPHVHSPVTTKTIMRDVLIALAPAMVMSIVFFGFRALTVTAVSVLACYLFEKLYNKLMKKHDKSYDLSVPTIKACNAITVLGHNNNFFVEQSACIRCGKCIGVCPMRLMPVLMYKALYTSDVEEMKATNLMDCIECGCCAYNCPACVPLVLAFRSGKQIVRDQMAAAASKKA